MPKIVSTYLCTSAWLFLESGHPTGCHFITQKPKNFHTKDALPTQTELSYVFYNIIQFLLSRAEQTVLGALTNSPLAYSTLVPNPVVTQRL